MAEYRFGATVHTVKLGTKKVAEGEGKFKEVVEVPQVVVQLVYVDEDAAAIAAHLAAFQGREVTVSIMGAARQLKLSL